MGTVTAVRALLTFLTDEGQLLNFSIPRADMTKSLSQATAAMEAMIDSGGLCDEHGKASAPKHCRFRKTIRTRLV